MTTKDGEGTLVASVEPALHPELCEAIRLRRRVGFFYSGGFRLVEPYVYGLSRKGRELLRGYQVRGFSRSVLGDREAAGWRLFAADKIQDLAIADDVFEPKSAYGSGRDPAMFDIYCIISE